MHIGERYLEHLHSVFERLGKALFLRLQNLHHVFLLERQFRIGFAHQLREPRNQHVEKRLGMAELVAVTQGATNDSAQHIAASLITGDHAIDDEEGAGANMIGDDVERRRAKILRAGELRRGRDQLAKDIDFENAVHIL